MIGPGNRKVVSLLLMALFIWSSVGHADERIIVDTAKVNGHPVRLAFDTGAEGLVLFSSAAERLGLRVYPVKNVWQQALYQATEKCTVDFWSFSRRGRVAIVNVPSYLQESMDGLVGWSAVSEQVLVFNTLSNTVQFVRELPREALQWTRLDLRFWETTLVLKAPKHGQTGFVIVDTGSESGLGLSPPRWRAWRDSHRAQPVTLHAFYMPAAERVFARQQAWAREFSLGPLTLTDVLVEEADPVTLSRNSKKHLATLGLAALKRLDFVVDGKRNAAYVKPKTTPGGAPEHNRLGAVFVPLEKGSDSLTARVAEGSPAFDAGIRDGDLLLKIGTMDVSNWRSNSNKFSSFWSQPPGTRMDLTLRRTNEIFQTSVTLRQIIGPE